MTTVGAWGAPRGGRDASGAWLHTLGSRPARTFGSALESHAVAELRQMLAWTAAERAHAGISLRQLAGALKLPLSVITGAENGSTWPRMATIELLHAAFGYDLTLRGEARWLGALVRRLGEVDVAEVAVVAGLRRQTIYDLRSARSRPLSSQTVLRLSAALRMLAAEESGVDWGRVQARDPLPLRRARPDVQW